MSAPGGSLGRYATGPRRRMTDDRVRALLTDPAALNPWERNVLGSLADLVAEERLEHEAFRRVAGYRDAWAFRDKVERLARAGLLARAEPGHYALTELGRTALRMAARPGRDRSPQHEWLTKRQCDVLTMLVARPPGTSLQLAEIRRRLAVCPSSARFAVKQLQAAGYVSYGRRLVTVTDAGRAALTLMGGVTEDDVIDLQGYAHRADRHARSLHLRLLPQPFRAAAKGYLQDELARLGHVEGVASSFKAIRALLRHLVQAKPDVTDFHTLDLADVDGFLAQRSRSADGVASAKLAQTAQRELARSLRFLEYLRDRGNPLVPADFTTRTFKHRIAIVQGAAILRANGPAPAAQASDEHPLTPEEQTARELAKDRWEVARLAGVRRNPTCQTRTIGFEQVPADFRVLVKDYTRTLLLVSGCSPLHCANEVRVLGAFLAFYLERHAGATTLAELAAHDIDAWVAHLRATPNAFGRPRTDLDLVDRLLIVQRLVRSLERTDSPSAPARPFARIFLPERLPRAPRSASQDRIKYIPASVLAQLDAAIDRFEAPYVPVLLVLRASGWRISDVLSLRWDRCLEGYGDRWWLVGDIHKTRILGHRVPITAEVAAAIQVQIHAIRQGFSEVENPQRFLFPTSHPRRLGHPISPTVIGAALQRFVARCGITGPDGQPFHLRAHAFRHTKAVELINNGMGMAYVQHWLAHLSPEMTAVYARISEDTLRKHWEQAMAQGAVQIRAEGPQVIDPQEVIAGNELELAYIRGNLDATRVETGYCFKPLKMDCPFVEIACFSCHNHVTTADFLPQFRRQERDLLEQIDLGTAAGRPHWVEKNQKKLRAVQAIIAALEQQAVHGLNKAQREYGSAERARLDAARAQPHGVKEVA